MKVEVKECKKKEEKGFPKLMISNNGWIVLFTDEKVGMCLSKGHSDGIHYDEDSWYMPSFKDFNGSVKLSND